MFPAASCPCLPRAAAASDKARAIAATGAYPNRRKESPESTYVVTSPDGEIFQTKPFDEARVVQIPAIENHFSLQLRGDHLEIGAAEFLPLGDDGQRVGAL